MIKILDMTVKCGSQWNVNTEDPESVDDFTLH